MSSDMFIKIDGIDGESADDAHKKEIDILSWSLGATNAGSMAHGGGGGQGKVAFQDMHFTKRTDLASAKLFEACCKGTHIAKAVVTLRKQAGDDPLEYLLITLSDILVSSYQDSGHEGGGNDGSESFSLNFSKIEYAYKQQGAKGAGAGNSAMVWDVKSNKAK